MVVILNGVVDGGSVGLVGLNDGIGGLEMATTDAAEDLSEKMEGFLLGGIVGEREARVGLDDADGGEIF